MINFLDRNMEIAEANQRMAQMQTSGEVSARRNITVRLQDLDTNLEGQVIRFREALRRLEYGDGPQAEQPPEPGASPYTLDGYLNRMEENLSTLEAQMAELFSRIGL